MTKLSNRFYYECKAKSATVRLSQLNKQQRKAVFNYYDNVYLPMIGGLQSHPMNKCRRQEYCEQMIQVHITKERLLEFLEEVGHYGQTEA